MEPPIRCPPRIITHDCDNGTESSFRASDDSTIAESESIPPSPRQPPAYGDEGAPPHYHDDVDKQEAKARRKIKRTLCIRLMTSIFITVLVSLLVAAVVARIHDGHINTDWSSNQTLTGNNHTLDGTSFTMNSSKISTSAQPATVATLDALDNVQTSVVTHKAEATITPEPSASTPVANRVRIIDCAASGLFANATFITDTTPTATETATLKRSRRNQSSTEDEEDNLIGMSIYRLKGCLLARSAYKGPGIVDLVHKCSMMCPDKKLETNQARDVVTDEWGACG